LDLDELYEHNLKIWWIYNILSDLL
jgi:hypothetical protein